MKAVRLYSAGDLRVCDEPLPVPGVGEVLVRVVAVGLCGSDRHWFTEGEIGETSIAAPVVLGHEIVGVLERGAAAGTRVVLDPAIPCESCATCLRGDRHLCSAGKFAGHGDTDGGLRTFMAWPQHLCLPLPDPISNEEAVLLEPLGVALHALDLGRVGPGVSAGVFGCGPIGQLLVQLLLSAGAEVVVVSDPRPHRLAAALALGGSVAASERAELDLDVAFDVSGTDESLADALAAVRSAGRVVVVGIPSDDRTTFQASLARRKGLTILLSRRMRPEDLPRAIRLAEVRAVSLGPLVTESHSLQSAPLAFEALVAFRGTKIVVQSDAAGDASRVESTGRPRRN